MAFSIAAVQGSGLIQRKTDWNESKKETKSVALRKKRKQALRKMSSRAQICFSFFNFLRCLKKTYCSFFLKLH